MQNLIKRLEKKGWSKKEISKAVGIIQKAKQNKPKEMMFLEKRIYWVLLILIIASNFAVSVALIPVLIAIRGVMLYSIVILLGVIFGFLFELTARSIEHLERKHHIAIAVLIFFVALANVYIISRISNDISKTLSLKNLHNPVILSLVYAAAFALPYLIYRFMLKKEYYSAG